MTEPFSGDNLYLDVGLPGYTEIYNTGNPGSSGSWGSYSLFFLLLAAGAAGLAYKWKKRSNTDDEFVKADAEGNNSGNLLDRLKNPFRRRRKDDNDDDFDKVL